MLEDIKFNSLQELYNRVLPAIHSKIKELNRNNIKYIKDEDIWNALKEYKWNHCKVLNLSDMVDDILNSDNSIFIDYVSEKIKKQRTEVNLEGDLLYDSFEN